MGWGCACRKQVPEIRLFIIYSKGSAVAEYASGASPSSPSTEDVNVGGQAIATITTSGPTFPPPGSSLNPPEHGRELERHR